MNGQRDPKKFAQTLRDLRTKAQITQEQLGVLLETDGASVANWERGHRFPSRRLWAGLQQLFPPLGPLLVPQPRRRSVDFVP